MDADLSAAPEGEARVGPVHLDLGAERPAAAIRIPAREAGVAVVRQFIAGMGHVLHLDDQACEDLKLATTEACTNAVVHAYPQGRGSVEVHVDTGEGDDLTVTVRDAGQGLPDGAGGEHHEGYGLSLIHAVSHDLHLGSVNASGGTEVRMHFRHARETPEEPLDAVHSPVLRRVIAMMAAYAGFSMDRLSDAVLVAETVAAHAPSYTLNGTVHVALEDGEREVVLRVGPLADGGAQALLEASRLPIYGPVLEHLADGVEPTPASAGSDEYLVVRLAARD